MTCAVALISAYVLVRPVEVEGNVEYKSLPSGLHNIQEDLVYVTVILLSFFAKRSSGILFMNNMPVSVRLSTCQPKNRSAMQKCSLLEFWYL